MVAAKNSAAIKGGAERRMRLLRPRGSVNLGKVASSLATQGLCLGDRKVESQIICEPEATLLRKEQLGKLGEEEEDGEEEPMTERRKEYTDLVERKEQCFNSHSRKNSKIACHASALALAITEKKCREAEM